MSLFQCENCGCRENTACASQGFAMMTNLFDWSYAPELKGKQLCSVCGPEFHKDGTRSRKGQGWHNLFDQIFFPIGTMRTNSSGNLEHIETGDTDIDKYVVSRDKVKPLVRVTK